MSSHLSAGTPDWLTSTPPGVMWPDHMRKHFCFNISSMVFVYVWFLCLDVQPAAPPLAGLLRLQEDWRPDTGPTGPAASRRYHGARVGGQRRLWTKRTWWVETRWDAAVVVWRQASRTVQGGRRERSESWRLPAAVEAVGGAVTSCLPSLRLRGTLLWRQTLSTLTSDLSENQRLGPERHRTSSRFDLEVPQLHRNKKYCGRRRTDQSEDSVRTDAASSGWRAASDSSSSSVCSCTVLCVCMYVCVRVCVNTVQRNYFKEPVGCCSISYSSFCLVASASVFLLLLIWY